MMRKTKRSTRRVMRGGEGEDDEYNNVKKYIDNLILIYRENTDRNNESSINPKVTDGNSQDLNRIIIAHIKLNNIKDQLNNNNTEFGVTGMNLPQGVEPNLFNSVDLRALGNITWKISSEKYTDLLDALNRYMNDTNASEIDKKLANKAYMDIYNTIVSFGLKDKGTPDEPKPDCYKLDKIKECYGIDSPQPI
jgi:hypothetical protein